MKLKLTHKLAIAYMEKEDAKELISSKIISKSVYKEIRCLKNKIVSRASLSEKTCHLFRRYNFIKHIFLIQYKLLPNKEWRARDIRHYCKSLANGLGFRGFKCCRTFIKRMVRENNIIYKEIAPKVIQEFHAEEDFYVLFKTHVFFRPVVVDRHTMKGVPTSARNRKYAYIGALDHNGVFVYDNLFPVDKHVKKEEMENYDPKTMLEVIQSLSTETKNIYLPDCVRNRYAYLKYIEEKRPDQAEVAIVKRDPVNQFISRIKSNFNNNRNCRIKRICLRTFMNTEITYEDYEDCFNDGLGKLTEYDKIEAIRGLEKIPCKSISRHSIRNILVGRRKASEETDDDDSEACDFDNESESAKSTTNGSVSSDVESVVYDDESSICASRSTASDEHL